MKKILNVKYMSVYITLFCVTLIHAQLPPTLPVTSLPATAPTQIPAAGANGQPTSSAKYAEYQSYCRQNEFDEKLILSDEQKKRRIDLIQQKLEKNASDKVAANALIKEYMTTKDLKKAEETFKKYSDIITSEDQILWATEISIQKKMTTAAVAKLEKYISENPTSVKALIKLAQIKKTLRFYAESADIFLDLQQKNKKSDYSIELCEIYTLDSHHKDAEKQCQLAAERNPKNHLPEIFLGISFREREFFNEAQMYFENSLKKYKSEFAYTCLGELFYLKKDRKKTIEYLNQAVEINRFSYRAQLGLAMAQFEEKKYDLALENFKQACTLGQKDTLAMRKSQKILDEKKSPLAQNYYDEIQKCNTKELF
jgi:tetratricopeptide (TPR) repeat protein